MTKEIKIGNIKIGNNNLIRIQSMTNTDTSDVNKTVEQILMLEKAGCEIVRVSVPDIKSALVIDKIKEQINIPLVADIHFDYKLAIMSMERGVDKIRINPGNIGSSDNIKEVIKVAKNKNIPIRIGVNSGSLEQELINKYNGVTPEALVESAINKINMLEQLDYSNIVVSLKASSVPFTLKAYRQISKQVNYPMHIGITESGTTYAGTIKSSVGIGALLAEGIGDTLRVSLTGDVIDEVKCAKEILKAMELRDFGVTLVSCPTCARTQIDLIKLANQVEDAVKDLKANIKVAVMGCVVNGPGESKEADIGIAGGKGFGIIFKKGVQIKKVPENELLDELIKEVKIIASEKNE